MVKINEHTKTKIDPASEFNILPNHESGDGGLAAKLVQMQLHHR
jgi:hypothetical protein